MQHTITDDSATMEQIIGTIMGRLSQEHQNNLTRYGWQLSTGQRITREDQKQAERAFIALGKISNVYSRITMHLLREDEDRLEDRVAQLVYLRRVGV